MDEPGAVKPERPRRKRRGHFHHGDLAEQLARAASDVVEKEGHRGLNLKQLARSLGVTEPAIYRHYESRDHLLAEVALRGLLDFVGVLREAVEPYEDPFAAIRAYGRTYVRAAAARPGWFRLLFSRFGTEELMRYPRFLERMADAEQGRMELLERWRGALPSDDDRVADLYRLVWGTVHGLASFVVERVFQLVQTDEERIAAADVAIDMLVQSLRARALAR